MSRYVDPVIMRPDDYINVRKFGRGGSDDIEKRVYPIGSSLYRNGPWRDQPLNFIGVRNLRTPDMYDAHARNPRPWFAEEHIPIMKTPPILPFFSG